MTVFKLKRLVSFAHCFMARTFDKNIIVYLVKKLLFTLSENFYLVFIQNILVFIVAHSVIQIVSNERLDKRNYLAVELAAVIHKLHMIVCERFGIKRFILCLIVNGRCSACTAAIVIKCFANKAVSLFLEHHFINEC